MAIAALAGSALVAGLGISGTAISGQGSFTTPILGSFIGWVGAMVGLLTIRPSVPRPLVRWPATLFASQGIGLFGVLTVALLLYSATRPAPAWLFALVVAGSFMAASVAQALVFSAFIKDRGSRDQG